jgi:hypothetical protein
MLQKGGPNRKQEVSPPVPARDTVRVCRTRKRNAIDLGSQELHAIVICDLIADADHAPSTVARDEPGIVLPSAPCPAMLRFSIPEVTS